MVFTKCQFNSILLFCSSLSEYRRFKTITIEAGILGI